jgi:hypothetical protein
VSGHNPSHKKVVPIFIDESVAVINTGSARFARRSETCGMLEEYAGMQNFVSFSLFTSNVICVFLWISGISFGKEEPWVVVHRF